jgi:hypothetical protein
MAGSPRDLLPGLKQKFEIREGNPGKKSWRKPKITIALRPVVRTAYHPRHGSRSEGIMSQNGPPVNEIKR